MLFIDTHAHLYASDFDADRSEMLERAFSAGVHKIYLPNIEASTIDITLALEAAYPEQCFAMMGLHPCSVKADFEEELATVKAWLGRRPFVAIGEIGIDLYWDKTFFEEQRIAFRKQSEWAIALDRPIVVHARESIDVLIEEVVAIRAALPDAEKHRYRGVFHCFTGSIEQGEQIIAQGFMLGIGGVLTYPKAGMEAVVAALPLEHIVLETDAPYLPPVPYRGKRNESSYVPIIAARLATAKGLPISEIAAVTTANAERLFK